MVAHPIHVVTERTEPDTVIRVDLAGSLNGRHVLVDASKVTFGFLEDVQSGQATLMLDALSRAVGGGDLVAHGSADPTPIIIRDELRQLTIPQIKELIDGIAAAVTQNPKRGAQ